MFVLLRTVELSSGFLSRNRQKKILRKSLPVSVSSENGLPFFVLDVPDKKGGLDFSLIEEKCGHYVSRIVAPRNISLPDSSRLKRFIPEVSCSFFVFNTALKIIEDTGSRAEKNGVTVIDRNAVMCNEIRRLLPYASPLRIITARPERYSSVCRRIYDEFGASVMVRPFYEPCSKKDIVICCDGATTESMNDAAVFSLKRGINGKIRFYCSGISLLPKHSGLVPENIDPTDFASALTELCGSTAYKQAVFSDIESSCKLCDDNSPSKCLECYISGSPYI